MATAANTTYATTLYNTVLFRNGTAAEVSNAATALDVGQMTQAQMVTSFEVSTEATANVDPIIRLYQGIMGRAPDTGGLTFWAAQERASANPFVALVAIAQGFTTSAEFATLYGSSTPNPTAFLTALYKNVLGRTPDSGGLNFWLGQLGATPTVASEANVQIGFTNSAEFIANSTTPINAWLTTANTNAQAGSTSPYPNTITGIVPPPVVVGSTFTLTAGTDTFVGTTATDTFVAPFSNGGTITLNAADTLTGNGGNDVLNIVPTPANSAVTLDDTLWTHVTGIQNIVVNSTGTGAQSIILGPNFNAAFATGINLTDSATTGSIAIAMGALTVAETLTVTTTDGNQTLTTGSGLTTVTASSGLGSLTIVGAKLATVTATTTGSGSQTITSTGNGPVNITATDNSGAQTIVAGNGNTSIIDVTVSGLTTIKVGNGNDTINLSGSGPGAVENVTVGSGSNTIILNGSHAVADNLTFSAVNAGSPTIYTTVTNIHAADTITFANIAVSNTVTNQATAVASISAGIAAATLTSGFNVFHDAGNTYIYEYTGSAATSELVTLLGAAHTVTAFSATATILA